jgi:hypothetical protein
MMKVKRSLMVMLFFALAATESAHSASEKPLKPSQGAGLVMTPPSIVEGKRYPAMKANSVPGKPSPKNSAVTDDYGRVNTFE